MARADKVEVVLSATDRQLLRDIRDALRALGVEPEDEAEATDAVRRLVESGKQEGWYIFTGSNGYAWNGSGWVPKE